MTSDPRPSHADRRLSLHAQVDALMMHARSMGARISREGARNLLNEPGDPVARLRLIVAELQRRQEGR